MLGMMIDIGPKFYGVPFPCPIHDLKVKVMDLEFYVKSFTLKFLGPKNVSKPCYISLMFCMMIDTGPKFYVVPPPL